MHQTLINVLLIVIKTVNKGATSREASPKMPDWDLGLKVNLLGLDKGKTHSSIT